MTRYEELKTKLRRVDAALKKAREEGNTHMVSIWAAHSKGLQDVINDLAIEEAEKERSKGSRIGYTPNTYYFEQLENPRVKITSIKEMLAYLRKTVLFWNGCGVLGFKTIRDEVRIKVLMSGPSKWTFFGYIRDIGHNIQKGYYEDMKQ